MPRITTVLVIIVVALAGIFLYNRFSGKNIADFGKKPAGTE